MSLAYLSKIRFGLGKDSMSDLLKFIAVNIYDVLNELTDHDHLKGTLALDAFGESLGPTNNNSSYLFTPIDGGIEWRKMDLL